MARQRERWLEQRPVEQSEMVQMEMAFLVGIRYTVVCQHLHMWNVKIWHQFARSSKPNQEGGLSHSTITASDAADAAPLLVALADSTFTKRLPSETCTAAATPQV